MSDNYAVLMGTKGGPAIRPGSSMPTSHLFCLEGHRFVVDCGLGVTRGLVDQGIELKTLSTIFITHLHSDHYLELGPLLHTAWTAGLKTPVDIWGPPGLERYWQGFMLSMKDDVDLRISDEGRPDLASLVSVHQIDPMAPVQIGSVVVSAIKTLHPPLVDCYALSFRCDSCHIVFSGDTAPLPELETFAAGADLLVHEAMLEAALPSLVARVGNGTDKLMEHLKNSHTAAHQVAACATAARVKRLALAHLVPADDPNFTHEDWKAAVVPHWKGPLFIGVDGLRIDL